jgi:hypothetical protein
MSRPVFDPLRALQLLVYGSVRFVLIGGLAGRTYGSNLITNDLDICYDRSPENVARLVQVLDEINARLRGVDEDVPFLLDPETILTGDTFTFETDVGALDCIGTPAGTGGYAQLAKGATEVSLGAFGVKVAALDDLIAMKEASGRPKDREAIEVLSALDEEISRSPLA